MPKQLPFKVEEDEVWHEWDPSMGMPVSGDTTLKVGGTYGKTMTWENKAYEFDWGGGSFRSQITHYATRKARVDHLLPSFYIDAIMELKNG